MAAKNTHRFELRMGKLGLALFILGMSALLFAVFLFGVNVGKNIDTYPINCPFYSGYDQRSDGPGRQAVRNLWSARRKKKNRRPLAIR